MVIKAVPIRIILRAFESDNVRANPFYFLSLNWSSTKKDLGGYNGKSDNVPSAIHLTLRYLFVWLFFFKYNAMPPRSPMSWLLDLQS